MLDEILFRGDGFDAMRVIVVALALAVCVAYLGLLNGAASALRTAVKTAGILILSSLPLTFLGTPNAPASALLLLAVALALSALGDFFLALKDQRRFFVPGLASFLAAHVAYLIAFLPHASRPDGVALAAIAAVLAAAALLLARIAPHLGSLRVPVFAYFAVIMAMVAAALSIREAWILSAGAAVFALSDSLIAVRKFAAPFALINEAVWITYVAAQFMIAAGFLNLIL
ncbi:MAG: lysoplasmalogenase [Alphaproteobacteria bacterium]|nr:lysoplasmalogenase [Alphaproteobacteria bacterium]